MCSSHPAARVPHRPQIEQPEHLGLLDGLLDRPAIHDIPEVDERAGDGGDGDAVLDGEVLLGQRSRPVEVDPRPRADAFARDGDLDIRPVVRA